MHKGNGLNRQGTLDGSAMTPGSRAVDGSALSSGGASGGDCESNNSAASVTSLAAFLLLEIFNTLFSFACTTYSLPILTME